MIGFVRWLQCRAVAAYDLWVRGRVTRGEADRCADDAMYESYSGPLTMRDGSTCEDERRMKEFGDRAVWADQDYER